MKDVEQRFKTAGATMLSHRFHEIIGDMPCNPYLMASLTRMLIDRTRLSLTFYRPASPAEPELVVKASRRHDPMYQARAFEGDFTNGRVIMSAMLPLMSVLQQGGKFVQCIK